MLNVFFGNMPEAVYNTAVFFKNDYEDEWITDSLVKEMIRDVDHSEVIDNGVIDSPVLGKIPPLGLSGGVKTLILVLFEPGKVFNASTCGDNCAKWLLRISMYSRKCPVALSLKPATCSPLQMLQRRTGYSFCASNSTSGSVFFFLEKSPMFLPPSMTAPPPGILQAYAFRRIFLYHDTTRPAGVYTVFMGAYVPAQACFRCHRGQGVCYNAGTLPLHKKAAA